MTLKIDSILNFSALHTPIERYQLAPEKLIDGNPQQRLQNHYSSPCDQFHSGIWGSDAGSWNIDYTEHEYCEILEGMSIITDVDGQSITVKVGDRFVIPAGFKGVWTVPEQCRKIYVIFEQK